MNHSEPIYAIIVDTDSYAGNFERGMCAYITGQYGECGVGTVIAETARKELGKDSKWFDENVLSMPDEHGCHRPVKIEPTPGFFNDGMGNSHKIGEDPDLVYKKYIEAQERYYNPHIKNAEKHIASGKKEWEKDLKGYHKAIDDAKKNGPSHCLSYQSIIILLDKKPTKKIQQIVTKRVAKFAESPEKCGETYASPMKILAIRFIKRTITTIDEDLEEV